MASGRTSTMPTLWAEKLAEDELNIHGRRVSQAFKDFDFRPTEALVAENAKIQNIEQVFASPELQADLAAMGLTELNNRLVAVTQQLVQLMYERNEEQSAIVVGELKAIRDALPQKLAAFLTYLNAVQELQPEEQISLAAQYYNQDLQKIELQLAQSRKGGNVSDKPQPPPPTPPKEGRTAAALALELLTQAAQAVEAPEAVRERACFGTLFLWTTDYFF